jgi:hypothetical protein
MALNANQEYLGDNPGIDERYYSPTPEELSFFLTETHIHDEVALKSHLIDVQARAYAVSLIVTSYVALTYVTSCLGSSIPLYTAFWLYEVS